MKTLSKIIIAGSIAFMPLGLYAQQAHRWSLENEGHISWNPTQTDNHHDHIEMSGKSVSVVLRY